MLVRTERPPMGWNSWNVYLGPSDEETLKATMRLMAQHLLPYGYEYCVADAGWSGLEKKDEQGNIRYDFIRDCYGRPWPHPERYPSAADGTGFLHLAEYAHSLGLKFGLHMMRGMGKGLMNHGYKVKGTDYLFDDVIDLNSDCSWCPGNCGVKVDHPASQLFYDSLFELFASWKVDFVKYDDLCSPLHAEEIQMIHRSIESCGRDILLSLSPGDWCDIKDAAFYSEHSSMWRIAKDFWDNWEKYLRHNFDAIAQWNQYIDKPGWPDPDMIPIGWICEKRCHLGVKPRLCRLTLDEQRSMFTLYCISRSPLILTVNLLRNTDELYRIQTQPDCIALDQRGSGNRVLLCGEDAPVHVWRGHADGLDYLACFNLQDKEDDVTVEIPEDLRGKHGIDVWTGYEVAPLGEKVVLPISMHGCMLLRLR